MMSISEDIVTMLQIVNATVAGSVLATNNLM